jgi:hypothetical protein
VPPTAAFPRRRRRFFRLRVPCFSNYFPLPHLLGALRASRLASGMMADVGVIPVPEIFDVSTGCHYPLAYVKGKPAAVAAGFPWNGVAISNLVSLASNIRLVPAAPSLDRSGLPVIGYRRVRKVPPFGERCYHKSLCRQQLVFRAVLRARRSPRHARQGDPLELPLAQRGKRLHADASATDASRGQPVRVAADAATGVLGIVLPAQDFQPSLLGNGPQGKALPRG